MSSSQYGSIFSSTLSVDAQLEEEIVLTQPEAVEDPLTDDDDDDSVVSEERLKARLLEKVHQFTLPVNPDLGYRATVLRILDFSRPHMRAFHGSWMLFLTAWLVWFSMAPLLPIIAEHSIPMTKADIWTGNLLGLTGTIALRLVLGPLCDQYGGRGILIGLLVACAIPSGMAGFLVGHSFVALLVVRFWVGCVGGTLVPAQFWITAHFTPACSGVALATAAGWGALGGGVAQVFMGSVLYPWCLSLCHGNADLAWRIALTIPAGMALATAAYFYYYSDDHPLGPYDQIKRAGLLQERSAVDSFRSGALNLNAWILFVQFGASLGIELTVESGMAMHLADRFDELTTARAAAYASLFGLMNLFARGLGGLLSDKLHERYSLRGRLAIQMLLMLAEGVWIFGFVQAQDLTTTLLFMLAFAATGQMSMGTCFGIVPYVDPRSTGTIAGIVGAGGNVGAVALASVFRTQPDLYAFQVMGVYCWVAALLTPLIVVSGYQGLLFGHERKGPLTLLTPRDLKLPDEDNDDTEESERDPLQKESAHAAIWTKSIKTMVG